MKYDNNSTSRLFKYNRFIGGGGVALKKLLESAWLRYQPPLPVDQYRGAIFMAGNYVKIWTTILHDEKFLSLTGNQRGVYFQLIMECKCQSDSGHVYFRSYAQAGHTFGAEESTVRRVLGVLQAKSLIEMDRDKYGTIHIHLPKYLYWQRVKPQEVIDDKRQNPPKSGKAQAKSLSTRPDQTRPDHICQNDKKEGELEPQKLIDLFNQILAPPLNKVKILRSGSKRLKTITAALKEHPDIKFWKYIYKTASESSWLCGRKGGWKADFNWLLNPNRLEETYEGKYDNNPIMTPQEEARHYRNKRNKENQ